MRLTPRLFALASAALLALLAAGGCAHGGSVYPVDESHPKRCRADSECRIVYGISYRGFCDQGCFNTRTRPDPGCAAEAAKSAKFPGGLGCVCEAGLCSLRRK
jgi:hypothetical protein